jgi:hypothetical protein
MRGGYRIFAAALAAGVASGALAYTRETTHPGDPTQGYCTWWGGRTIHYQVNAWSLTSLRGAPPPCGDPALAVTTVQQAMDTWGGATRTGELAACTDFSFEPAAVPTTTNLKVGHDGHNVVLFRAGRCSVVAAGDPCLSTRGACASKYGCWDADQYGASTIGLTTTTFDTVTGQILDSDMELYASGGDGGAGGTTFRCTGTDSPDLGAVVTHEAGHMLGLDHVCADPSDLSLPPAYRQCPDPSAVMKPTVGEPSFRVLSQDDVAGICKIYPKGGATSTCAPPQDSSGGGCCASAGGVGVLALLGLLATRRRCAR